MQRLYTQLTLTLNPSHVYTTVALTLILTLRLNPYPNPNPNPNLYVPTCIHLFPHARTDTIQVVEHEPNFSKFYPRTISFLVSQFCTLESSLCVSSSDYYLIFPFGSSLIKVVLNPKIRTTECTHQTTVSTQNELMIDNNVDLCANPIIDRLWTKELNTRAIQ